MITTFSTNLLPSPNLYYNSHYEKFADGTVKCIDDEIPFDIPQNWSWCRLFAICTFLSRGKSPKYSNEKKYPVFAQKCNLKSGGISLEQARFLDPTTLSKWSEEYKLRTGDILVNSTGTGTVCRTRLFDNKYLGNYPFVVPDSHVSVVRTHHEIISDFICHYITSPTTQKFLENNLAGSTNQKELYIGILTNLLIPIPPKAEQERISKRISELLLKCASYDVLYNQLLSVESELQPQLKKSILQYAIQGKLVAQNPKDEPASELLKRINEEKEQLIKDGKIKREKNTSIIFKGDDNKYYEKLGGKTTEITEEIPYELPNNWVFVRLANLCWLDDGYKASGEKLPYMDAKYHRGKSEITYLTQGKIVEPPCKAILVDGENSGEIFNITEKGYLGSTFKVLQISKCISEDWLHILLNTYRDLFKNNKVGAAIPHLNKNLFRNLIVGLPPIEEQQRITDRVEKLMKGIEGI